VHDDLVALARRAAGGAVCQQAFRHQRQGVGPPVGVAVLGAGIAARGAGRVVEGAGRGRFR